MLLPTRIVVMYCPGWRAKTAAIRSNRRLPFSRSGGNLPGRSGPPGFGRPDGGPAVGGPAVGGFRNRAHGRGIRGRGVGALLHLDLHTALHAAKTPVLELLVRFETFADEDIAAVVLHDLRIDVRIDFLGPRIPEQLLGVEGFAVGFLNDDVALGLPQFAVLVIDGVVGRQHGVHRGQRIVLVGSDLHALAEFAVRFAGQRITFEQRRDEMVRPAAVLRHHDRKVLAVFGHHRLLGSRRAARILVRTRE